MQNRLSHSSFALLRVPLQPLISADSEPVIDESHRFAEAVHLASASFYNEYKKLGEWQDKDVEKLRQTLSKYWLRSCTRCTPYGAFAGVALVHFSTEKDAAILINTNEHHRLAVRVDMDYLAAIVQTLVHREDVRSQISFTANNSLYRLPDGAYRYATFYVTDGTRKYELQALAPSSYLDGIIKLAAQSVSYSALLDWLIEYENASLGEATTFLTELILAQVLIPDLESCITGEDPLRRLVQQLKRLEQSDELAQITATLSNVNNALANFTSGVSALTAISEKLQSMPLQLKEPQSALQADMHLRCVAADIHSGIVKKLLDQVDALCKYTRRYQNRDLQDFEKKFAARYEEQWVPLSLALDVDLGLGYGKLSYESAAACTIIDELPIAGNNQDKSFTNDQFTALALRKYTRWLSSAGEFIELHDSDLEELRASSEPPSLSASMHLMGSFLKQNDQFDEKNFFFDYCSIGGPSAGNMLARFAQSDETLCDRVRGLSETEQAANPEIIFAEIVHLPQSRTANILLRPLLRQYEIPYVGLSGAAENHQILVSDLLVGVSDGEIVLWSKKHNKRVIPRLTTAHNYSYQSLPVYKFLCDLQSQGHSFPVMWDWGVLSNQKHLPRVVYKNIILHKARWIVEEEVVKNLSKVDGDALVIVERWHSENGIPDRVVYKEGDNELLIDFQSESGKKLFLRYLRRYKRVVLEEFLFTKENCIVHDSEGKPYTNEIILPLTCTPAKSYSRATRQWLSETDELVQRQFAPNSEWQYFKIYCGARTAETIMLSTVLPFAETGLAAHRFERFFFTRYRDEFGHLRIRFYNGDNSKQHALQASFMEVLQPLLDNGAIDKVVLDTYKRELERYDARIISETEQLFHCDSLCVLTFLQLLDGVEEPDKYRMLFALRGIDMLLDDFGLWEWDEKHRLLQVIQTGFFREYGGSPPLQKSLNSKYRQHQQDIFSHMDSTNDGANEIDEAIAVFRKRSEMNLPVIERMKERLGEDWGEKLPKLLPSYIHMFMNRMFIAQQRTYELVLYHFLEKYYRSKIAMLNHADRTAIEHSTQVREQALI